MHPFLNVTEVILFYLYSEYDYISFQGDFKTHKLFIGKQYEAG